VPAELTDASELLGDVIVKVMPSGRSIHSPTDHGYGLTPEESR
jgi:hypothetical protein